MMNVELGGVRIMRKQRVRWHPMKHRRAMGTLNPTFLCARERRTRGTMAFVQNAGDDIGSHELQTKYKGKGHETSRRKQAY